MANPRFSQPLRYQIRKEILDFIADKGYQPGDQFPSEQELSEILGVSRFSLREAIHLLEEERIIATKHGTGRFLVAIPGDFNIDLSVLQSVTEMLAGYGIEAVNQLLNIEKISDNHEIAERLNLQPGEPAIAISRVRYAENIPIIYSIDYIPETLLPTPWNEETFKGSLFSFIEHCGIVLDHSQVVIRTVFLDSNTTPFVQDPSVPWILLEQTICNQKGTPVIYSKDYHHSEYISFHMRRFRR